MVNEAPAPEEIPAEAFIPGPDPRDVPTSAWIASPAPKRRSALSTIVTIGAIVVAVLVVVGVVGTNLRLFQPRGQILFGTSLGNLCTVGGVTRTLTADDPVFFAAVLKNRLGGDETIRLTVTRDGQPFFDSTDPAPADGTEFECYGSRESFGPLEPGVYAFEVIHGREVEASGTLTVT